MLTITIPAGGEVYDEGANEFISCNGQTLQLEHSLVSLSKWESKWCKPFITKGIRTLDESIDYIRCMTLTQNVNPIIYKFITQKNIDEVSAYIDAPMTATKLPDQGKSGINRDVITAERIYYWMIALQIPFECQKWHLNRLISLINMCNFMNQPPKKMSEQEIMRRNSELNAARRKALNTRG